VNFDVTGETRQNQICERIRKRRHNVVTVRELQNNEVLAFFSNVRPPIIPAWRNMVAPPVRIAELVPPGVFRVCDVFGCRYIAEPGNDASDVQDVGKCFFQPFGRFTRDFDFHVSLFLNVIHCIPPAMPELRNKLDELGFDCNPLLSQVGNSGAQRSAAVFLQCGRHINTAVHFKVAMDGGKLGFCLL
jgi:hypothetical protein